MCTLAGRCFIARRSYSSLRLVIILISLEAVAQQLYLLLRASIQDSERSIISLPLTVLTFTPRSNVLRRFVRIALSHPHRSLQVRSLDTLFLRNGINRASTSDFWIPRRLSPSGWCLHSWTSLAPPFSRLRPLSESHVAWMSWSIMCIHVSFFLRGVCRMLVFKHLVKDRFPKIYGRQDQCYWKYVLNAGPKRDWMQRKYLIYFYSVGKTLLRLAKILPRCRTRNQRRVAVTFGDLERKDIVTSHLFS